MANHSLPHHLAGDCSDDDYSASSSATVSFPSFWPPFPSFLSDSDAPFVVPPRHTDRCVVAAQQETAAAFLGLDFPEEEEYDDEEGGVEWAPPDELGLPLCWDCLQLEEEHEGHHQRWDGLGLSDAEDWEQVAARAEDEAASAARGLQWEEVLLAANSLGGLVIDDVDTYLLDDDEDVLFGHLAAAEAEQEPPAKGGRAAAKAAVEGLPTVVVAQADGAVQCAVCKDGIEAGEGARRLPCAHLYHGGCILPWLAIRNTCPLCRHELPTDDADCERWKARPAAGGR